MKNNQKFVLQFIIEYKKEHDYVPSHREICEGTGYKSLATVNGIMNSLFDDGYLETEAGLGSPRAYRIAKDCSEM